jgi:hypothetical protein
MVVKWNFMGIYGGLMGSFMGFYMGFNGIYPLVNCSKTNWRITMLFSRENSLYTWPFSIAMLKIC